MKININELSLNGIRTKVIIAWLYWAGATSKTDSTRINKIMRATNNDKQVDLPVTVRINSVHQFITATQLKIYKLPAKNMSATSQPNNKQSRIINI